MRKIKKCLFTSLSLGLAGISVGAIVASCATTGTEEQVNNNPDPASENSLVTNPGDPLTDAQKEYQQKLAAEIKTQFDANEKLDYSKPEDKAKIDKQIVDYENDLTNGDLKDLIAKYSKINSIFSDINNPPSETEFSEALKSVYEPYYDNFKQKNLLPTEIEIKNFLTEDISDESTSKNSWKVFSGMMASFYTDPKNIILLVQLAQKIKNTNSELNKTKINNIIYGLSFTWLQVTNSFFISNTNKESPSFKSVKQFSYFFNNLNFLLTNNPNPDTNPNEPDEKAPIEIK